MSNPRLDLTDTEWMSIIDRDRDGLPPCCANISELRDEIISTARNGGEAVIFTDWTRLKRVLGWCFPDHDVPSPVIQKIIDQVGFTPADEHEAQHEVVL